MTLLLTFILIISVLPFVVQADPLDEETITQRVSFSAPTLVENEYTDFIDVLIDGAPLHVYAPGAPELPRYTIKIPLPLGATDVEVEFESLSSVETMNIAEGTLVSPAPIPAPLDYSSEVLSLSTMDESVYNTDAFYPEAMCTSQTFVGQDEYGNLATWTIVDVAPCQYNPIAGVIDYITEGEITLTYNPPEGELGTLDTVYYDLLIISADAYIGDLIPLVEHKEEMGLQTKLVSLSDIYNNIYDFEVLEDPVDEQEQIKYFMYEAKNHWDIQYVMAVGGWRTFWGFNKPSVQFPVRSIPDEVDEPTFISDQYYSCFVRYHHQTGYSFDDSLHNFEASPDVSFGRLACRNQREVRTLVDKIITYETTAYEGDWFNKFLSITGDGFGDVGQTTPNDQVIWTTTSYPNGEYTIYSQSYLEDDPSFKGPIDSVQVTVDHNARSVVTFHEHDHLLVEPLDEGQRAVYPGKPVAHIVVPSDDDILGNTDVYYGPTEAYGNDATGWATVDYSNNKLYIKIKSYDPSPKDDVDPVEDFASRTYYNVWVNNSDGTTVFQVNDLYSVEYYEGEMETQVAHDYIPDDEFYEKKLWTSNGNWTGMRDVINEFSEGYGLIYFAGHGNPMSWGDHLPGIPGGRDDGMINGMKCFNMDFGLARYESEEGDPIFPMDNLRNGDKLPIILVGGCHNSMIDSSLSRLIIDPTNVLFTVQHGAWIPECFDWWFIRVPQGGAIATIGCSGLGYGYLGPDCLDGLGGWINPEFFRVYTTGVDILGDTFTQTIINFANGNAPNGPHAKTFQEWVFLGDPSLKIGGYPPQSAELTEPLVEAAPIEFGDILTDGSRIYTNITNTGDEDIEEFTWAIRIDGYSPLGRYFGFSGTIFEEFLRGHIFRGQLTKVTERGLYVDELLEIASSPLFGFGHFQVNITIEYTEDETTYVAYGENYNADRDLFEEDGFLLGGRVYLYHEDE